MPPYILKNQRYSIHDGPGIRTTLVFQGCPLAQPQLLLPFHTMGDGKYERLKMKNRLKLIDPPTDERVEAVRQLFEAGTLLCGWQGTQIILWLSPRSFRRRSSFEQPMKRLASLFRSGGTVYLLWLGDIHRLLLNLDHEYRLPAVWRETT